MGSRLGVIIRSENGWKLYYDLGGVGARPPLARPSRSGHRLSRRAAPADVHPTAANSSAPGTSSGPRSRASRSDSRKVILGVSWVISGGGRYDDDPSPWGVMGV